jgi:hypothetical protein
MGLKVISRLFFIALLGFTSCNESEDEKVIQKPNIILIMTDDQAGLMLDSMATMN